MQEIGRTYLRYREKDAPEKLLRVEVLLEGAVVHLQIGEEKGQWPFKLINESSMNLKIFQTVSVQSLGIPFAELATAY